MMRTQPLIATLAVLLTGLAGCKSAPVQEIALDPLAQQALYDTTSSYYTDFSTYPKNIADLPIGIFDVGSPSTLSLDCTVTLDRFDNITGSENPDKIRDFAGEHFIYYTTLSDADNIYDEEGRINIHDAAIKNALFLVGDKCAQGEKERAKIIIAAGSITRSGGLDAIRDMLGASGSGVKIVGVVEEGAKSLFDELERRPMLNYAIGVMTDSLTIASGAWQQTIKDIMEERGLKASIPIVCQSVPSRDSISTEDLQAAVSQMLEGHYAAGQPVPICALVTDMAMAPEQHAAVREVIENYRSKRISGDYPYRSYISDKLIFINPSERAAMECYRTLRKDNNLALRITDQQVAHYSDLPM